MEIYVGNLPSKLDISELTVLFRQYGRVTDFRIVTDKFSGRPRGFGFVVMPENDEAAVAIKALSGKDFHGNRLQVSAAQSQSRMPTIKVEGS